MGSTEQSSNSQSETTVKRDPWKPTMGPLQDLIGQIGGLTGNTGPTGNETGALDALTRNAQAGNPFVGRTFNLADQLFAGGGAQGTMDQYNARMSPYADGQHFGPDGNPALKGYLDTIGNDVQNRVNSMFAASGRDMSGMNQQSLARGIAEGTAPILAQQYNTDVGRQIDASNSLYGAGNTTTGLLANLGAQGVQTGKEALTARDSAANQQLAIEAQRRNIPVSNIGNLTGLLTPLAQLGGRTKGESTTTSQSSTTPPLGMQILGGVSALKAPGAGWGAGK